ncbi:MAG: branched-chain amino acid ABC transporter permease [Anaerolineae bacterium]
MFQQLTDRFSFVGALMWVLRIAVIVIVVWGSFVSFTRGTYSLAQWQDLVIFGLAQGGVYALIALGYTMVYGILGFINFAHGEIFMSGAMVGFYVADFLANNGLWDANPFLSLLIVLAVSMATSTFLAVVLERVAYRPLRGAPRLIPLITAIGASFFLQYTFRGLFGAGVKSYPAVRILSGHISFLGIRILKLQLLVILAATLMMVLLYWFVEKTKTGRAMRAVAEDKEIAALMGVDVDRTIMTTFAVGGLMAGAAALLYSIVFRQVFFFTGFLPGIKAFTAAVLGGIGNIVGAMAGGLVLGMVESIGPILVLGGWGVPAPHQLKDVVAFMVLVLVLIFRPTGLLGERLAEERA